MSFKIVDLTRYVTFFLLSSAIPCADVYIEPATPMFLLPGLASLDLTAFRNFRTIELLLPPHKLYIVDAWWSHSYGGK